MKKLFIRKKRKNESYLKYLIALFHLWLGLLSSIIIFIVCLTGSIYAFKNQLLDSFSDDFTLETNSAKTTPLQKSITLFSKEFEPPTSIWVKENSIEISSYAKNNLGSHAYFNANTGEIVRIQNSKLTYFFEIILEIHRYLLVEEPGKLIVGISVLFFAYLLISGFIMWLPKRLKALKSVLTINFKLKIKRINYDLHRVLGFYALLPLLLIAITGLYVSFHWFKQLNIQALGGPSIAINQSNIGNNGLSKDIADAFNAAFDDLVETEKDQPIKTINELLEIAKDGLPEYSHVQIIYPFANSGYYSFKFYRKGLCSLAVYDHVKINQFGEVNKINLFSELDLYKQYMLIVKPLHTGEIFGITSIIIYFLMSLIGCSLPITGFIIWYNKVVKLKK
ncbi:PepSY-associated TM helix domain-containing protein [Tenacibaculum xiamenense]|uniref:PepSY-associated TM helix domain-containing protein n=1 Tax=Tenacibaculum xiamenense TaxID=1261553 RepID=UPI0038932057